MIHTVNECESLYLLIPSPYLICESTIADPCPVQGNAVGRGHFDNVIISAEGTLVLHFRCCDIVVQELKIFIVILVDDVSFVP